MSVVERAGRIVGTVRSPGVRDGEGRVKPGSFGPTGRSVLWTLRPRAGSPLRRATRVRPSPSPESPERADRQIGAERPEKSSGAIGLSPRS